jgi:hypothetical protein
MVELAHDVMLLAISPPAQACYMQLHIIASLDIRLVNPAGVDRPRKRQEEPVRR